jgi:hypothetical protein
MKFGVHILGFTIIASCCFATCEKKCWGADCADPVIFQLIDKSTQQDLVLGANPKFKLDSMQLKAGPSFDSVLIIF